MEVMAKVTMAIGVVLSKGTVITMEGMAAVAAAAMEVMVAAMEATHRLLEVKHPEVPEGKEVASLCEEAGEVKEVSKDRNLIRENESKKKHKKRILFFL